MRILVMWVWDGRVSWVEGCGCGGLHRVWVHTEWVCVSKGKTLVFLTAESITPDTNTYIQTTDCDPSSEHSPPTHTPHLWFFTHTYTRTFLHTSQSPTLPHALIHTSTHLHALYPSLTFAHPHPAYSTIAHSHTHTHAWISEQLDAGSSQIFSRFRSGFER